MKVSVLLPAPTKNISGGYKIVYDYTSWLYMNYGYQVQYFYFPSPDNRSSLRNYIKKLYHNYINKKDKLWYDFPKELMSVHRVGVNLEDCKTSDVIFVTSVETAIYIKQQSLKIPVLYLIQHIETWSMAPEKVYETYNYGFFNVAVSKWIEIMVRKTENSVDLCLPNPIEDVFQVRDTIESREVLSVLFMYHPATWKGSREAVAALQIVKSTSPSLKVSCFSTHQSPVDFPEWIDFKYKPSRKELVDLMNQHFIFLSTSYKEGYGLPVAEAMAAGCIVVSTDSGGVGDFAFDNQTAIIVKSPPEPTEVANAINKILISPNDHFHLSLTGSRYMMNFSLPNRAEKLHQKIKEIVDTKSN
jgi:glycosyltransferase involved in cell wall biosynthesis